MNRSLDFFLLDRLVERSVSRRSVREHAEPSGSDCVARMRRRLRSFGVAERSKRKAGGAARLSAAPFPGPAAPGMAGHVPLSGSVPEGPSVAWRRTCCRGGCTRADAATPRDARSEAEGPSPPGALSPGRVGSGGFRGRKMMGAGHSIDGNVRPPFDTLTYQSACRPRLSSAFR